MMSEDTGLANPLNLPAPLETHEAPHKVNRYDYTPSQWQNWLLDQGFNPVHLPVLLGYIYGNTSARPLPAKIEAALEEEFSRSLPEVYSAAVSRYDSSVKFLLRLFDGHKIEAVLMPESNRLTLCLSTQVGCQQACRFCVTGRMGLVRQLWQREIIAQVLLVKNWIKANPTWARNRAFNRRVLTNLVFMGMGEPLDNLSALKGSIDIFTHQKSFGIAQRRISVSTAGHLDGLRGLLAQFPKIPIALSLHATSTAKRNRLMPINRRYPFQDVLGFLKEHFAKVRPSDCFFIQYTVIAGVNDGSEDADQLAEVLQDAPVKINLIPLNEIANSRFLGPENSQLQSFRQRLQVKGFRVMIRYSKGQDIAGACGQLVTQS